jgi:ribonuclease BN (tRNA processing enzyme)
MQYVQFGNGSAFNHEMINSSFIFKSDTGEMLLVDCGWNVYSNLRRDQKTDMGELTTVFITHMDDDHIGSLRTLIYYMYFVRGKVLDICANKEVVTLLNKYLIEIGRQNLVVEDYRKEPQETFRLHTIGNEPIEINGFKIKSTASNHYQPASGIIVYGETGEAVASGTDIFITGDGMATPEIKDIILNHENDLIVFHDYSDWDEPSKQAHACLSSVTEEYPPELIEKLNWYHNDKAYLSGWFNSNESPHLVYRNPKGPKDLEWKEEAKWG